MTAAVTVSGTGVNVDFREAVSVSRESGGSFEWRCSFLYPALPLLPELEDPGVSAHAIGICLTLIL